jgi:release factor glutamine methyltransferase
VSETFDLIVSNPPYIGERERPDLDAEVARFDPPGALFAGTEGLDAYAALIPGARERLGAQGRLILEIGVTQAEPVESLLMRSGMVVESAVPDLSGRIRVLVTRRG